MRFVKAVDSLRIHFTLVGKTYVLLDEDEECFKIIDERGLGNWIPRRYMTLCEEGVADDEKAES